MVLQLAGLVLGAADGFINNRNQDQAYEDQLAYINQGLAAGRAGLESERAGTRRARVFMRELLGASESLENDLLGQIDPVTARGLRQVRLEREEAEARLSQELARRGIDSFTTRVGADASIDGASQTAANDILSRAAGLRSDAISRGRGAYLSALGASVDFETNAGSREAAAFSRLAGLNFGVQVQPPQGGGLAGFGNSLLEAHRTSVLEQAISNAGPGRSRGSTGGPAGLAELLGSY